jgi:hypothetical protein
MQRARATQTSVTARMKSGKFFIIYDVITTQNVQTIDHR